MARESGQGEVMGPAELKPLLLLSKRKPVPCAVGLAKDRQGVILLHRRLKPRKLMAELLRQAKASDVELDRASLRFGRARVDGGSDGATVHVSVNKEAPGALRMALVAKLRPAGFQRCEITVDEALDTEPDDGEEDQDGTTADSPRHPSDPAGLPAQSGPGAPGPDARLGSSPFQGTAPQAGVAGGDAATVRARLTALVRKAVEQAGPDGSGRPEIKATAVAARDALASGDLAQASRLTDELQTLLGGATVPAASPDAGSPGPSAPVPRPVAQVAAVDGDQSGEDVGPSDDDNPAGGEPRLQMVAYGGPHRRQPAGPTHRRTVPKPPLYRTLTIAVPADCASIAALELLMDRAAGLDEQTRWEWHGQPPAIETLRGKNQAFQVPATAPASPIEGPPIEVTASRPPATLQEATQRAWRGTDDGAIAAMPEDQRLDLARKKANDLALAQARFMAEHPGATAAEFVKSALLINSPQQLQAAYDDIKEALNGNANAFARIGAAAGGTAKISGWLLALVGVAYVASFAIGVGEVATLAAGLSVAAQALLATTLVASAVEADARLKAASQTSDPAEFHRQVEGAAAAELNIATTVVAIVGLKALEITARIPAVKGALDQVRAGLKDLRARIDAEPLASLRPKVLRTMAEARAKLAEGLTSAKALAAKQAGELDAMTVEQFAEQQGKAAGGANGAAKYRELLGTQAGRAQLAKLKDQLAHAMRDKVPAELDRRFGRYLDAVDGFDKAATAATDKPRLAAAAAELEKVLGERGAQAMLAEDQTGAVRDTAAEVARTDDGGPRDGTDAPPGDETAQDAAGGDSAADRSRGQQQAESAGVGEILADRPGYHFRVNSQGKLPTVVRGTTSMPQLALTPDGAGGYVLSEVGPSVLRARTTSLPPGVSAKVQPTDVKAAMTSSERSLDASELDARAAAGARIEARGQPDSAETRADYQRMRRASEQVGEVSASAYVRSQFPKAERVFGTPEGLPGRNGQFDQIWRDVSEDGSVRYIVVEAKGGSSGTGTAVIGGEVVAQGTPEYFDRTAGIMADSRTPGRAVGRALLDARKTGRVVINGTPRKAEIVYLRVQTPIVEAAPATVGGQPGNQAGPTTARQYDITPRTR